MKTIAIRNQWGGNRIFRIAFFVLLINTIFAGDAAESQYVGKDVFSEKGCDMCHAINGNGGKGGPDLGRRKYYGTHLELAATMWSHFPKMQKKMEKKGEKFQPISEYEMSCLIDYLLFLRFTGEKGNVFRGRKLLNSMNCTECHIFGGKGGDIGPDISKKKEYLSPLNLAEAMWNHGPQMAELFEEHGIEQPKFVKNDFVDLSAGLKSFMSPTIFPPNSFELGDEERGESLIHQKGCTNCHDSMSSENIGPGFEEMHFNYTVLEFAGRLWNHGPKMWEVMQEKAMEIPTFESGELADIITYIYKSKLQDKPGDIEKGHQLIAEKNCLDCHTLNGVGNNTAKKDFAQIEDLNSPIALIAKMWSHAPAMDEKLIEKDLDWPDLSARDLADLYAFFSSINKP
ncbi:MAG: c-type cytochrome [Fidelibacterota bacterium]